EHKAGISRDMIRNALDDALSGNVIGCIREGRPKLAHDAGQSARYALNWSSAPYTTRPAEFRGFFDGEGNRTDIPNEFFDVVIPNEPLSVIKVVGSVIRHSIGFQTKHGRRRQQVALSYQQIQNYARFGSRSDLAKAVRVALEKNYIIRVEEGVFSHRYGVRRSATYALCWSDYRIGQKIAPAVDESENRTSIGQISAPADQSEIQTSIKTKPENETINRQPAADTELAHSLVAIGFSEKTAAKLIREHTRQTIEEQIAWLPHRAPARSPAGLLRRAIEQAWPEPAKLRATEVQGTTGWEFARGFYAAYGGNRGEPVNEPSPREAQIAADFVQRLTRASAGESHVGEWGRALGQVAREQRNPFPSLQLAIRQLGDAFLVKVEKQRLHTQLASVTQLREQHEQTHRAAWLAWLTEQESAMQQSQPEEYARFIAKREHERADLAADPKPWSKKALDSFDVESVRLSAFRQYFGLPDFWRWDASINNQALNPTA
ncbi:hypothetical protein, partial [Prosthecobacter sp.]|uniref:hypothetical protein n=1 Tax=Prosthecobacter sp. TaxID=1965333 RepID=UPI0024896A7E